MAVFLHYCSFSQGFDRLDQPGFESWYRGAAYNPNGHWFLTGQQPYDDSTSQPGLLREIDTSGNVMNTWILNVAGNEFTGYNAVIALADSSVVMVGYTNQFCNSGNSYSHARRMKNGVEMWQRSYGDPLFASAAVMDSTLGLLSHMGLVLTTLEGDSLTFVALPPWPFRVRAVSDGFMVLNQAAIWKVAPDGTILDSLLNLTAFDLVELPDSGIAVVKLDSLLLLTPDLERSGIGVPLFGPKFRSIATWGDKISVCMLDTVFTFDMELDPITMISTNRPEGYDPWFGASEGDQFLTVGVFDAGSYGAACRIIPMDVAPAPLTEDVALSSMALDSIQFSLETVGPYVLLSGSGAVNGWLVNLGDDTLHSATLSSFGPAGSGCGYGGTLLALDSLSVAPNDSVAFNMGPAYIEQYTVEPSGSTDVPICIWVTCPDNHLDRDISNNTGCTSYTFTVGVEELEPYKRISAFPSPTTGIFSVQLPSSGSAWDVRVTEPSGRTVAATRSYSNRVYMDLSGRSPGLYHVIAQGPAGTEHARIVLE